MINLGKIVQKAKSSAIQLKLLNLALSRMIPFNKPHGFKIIELGDHHLKALLPYKKSNFNHIKGLHACALATLSEFSTGFLLLTRLDASKYRLIMKKIEIEYHYQGKKDAVARFEVTDQWIEEEVITPLQNDDAVTVICEVQIHDKAGNHLTTGRVHWQIKDWSKVKTKV